MELFQISAVFIILFIALYYYASEKVSIEMTSVMVIAFLMIFFYIFPVYNLDGNRSITVSSLLSGLSNPALITVFSLMIIGEALSETGALESVSTGLSKISKHIPEIGMLMALILVGGLSAFLNNVPMVVVFIPVVVVLAKKLKLSPTRWLMPLSFITILGGMTTLVGSSTNLLVSGALRDLNEVPFDFFSFSYLGGLLAFVGSIYVLFILPRVLPDKTPLKNQLDGGIERRFFATVTVDGASPLSGASVSGWKVDKIDADILVIQRGGHTYSRPFESSVILPGDNVLIAANRDVLMTLAGKHIDNLTHDDNDVMGISNQVLAEIIVSPNSGYLGRSLRSANLHIERNLIPIGLERNTGILQSGIMDIRLRAGDVLLVVGSQENITQVMEDSDFILLESSAEVVRPRHHVFRTLITFLTTIVLSASGILPVSIASFIGAVTMVALGCISFNEALKAIDRRVILLITTSLALGLSLQETGGASVIADNILYLMENQSPSVVLSVFFFLIMIMTNILSNQATAVLFTPIAVSLAHTIGVDVNAFTFAVVFAANCCFITPVAYQTNLLVMTPGQYNFKDFVKAGLPLAILIWVTYSIAAPIYFGF